MSFTLVHVLNRGVDKRKIFLDKQDHFRFIHNLFEFNNQDCVINNFRSFNKTKMNDIVSPTIKKEPKKLLVNIYAFCLMPNHYHLLLSPKTENGITNFMRKVNIGYAKYFNLKYQRVGALFQGRYKSVLIKKEEHFIYLPFYIHLNPLDLVAPEWRNNRLYDFKKSWNFLQNYKWSSLLDYLGKNNFPSVTNRNFLLRIYSGKEKYQEEMIKWLKGLNFESIKGMALE